MADFRVISGGKSAESRASRFQSAETYDRTLVESEHFRCIASLGSIVPGWVLVSPKRARLNLAGLTGPEESDLGDFADQVRAAIEGRFGPACMFEHGAISYGSETGCGVDQAHLHIVPLAHHVFENHVKAMRPEWELAKASWPHEIVAPPREYLWYSVSGKSRIVYPKAPESQFFRRAVANAVGRSEQWDYKRFPFIDNIMATHAALMGAFDTPDTRVG